MVSLGSFLWLIDVKYCANCLTMNCKEAFKASYFVSRDLYLKGHDLLCSLPEVLGQA